MTRSLLQNNQVSSNITNPNRQLNHIVLSVLVYGVQKCTMKLKQNIKLKRAVPTFVTNVKQNLKQSQAIIIFSNMSKNIHFV